MDKCQSQYFEVSQQELALETWASSVPSEREHNLLYVQIVSKSRWQSNILCL